MYKTQHVILSNFVHAYLSSYSHEKAELFGQLYRPDPQQSAIIGMNSFWRMQFSETDVDTREIRDSIMDDYSLNDYLPFLTNYLLPRVKELDLPAPWRYHTVPSLEN